ncbi:hypothetical protein EXIGLDRAFT_783371 [Exidia glandulosa HHB12029]|uniref:Uncharacterized protein n=1 Tax=Exidia glandulosa HHB12029 TaxID=1314781 RepID=A0A166N3I3_EXIGL|nr:hypothetical protein EXIGLDRAFT_783371 [Exidia glandulosa HHB12029]
MSGFEDMVDVAGHERVAALVIEELDVQHVVGDHRLIFDEPGQSKLKMMISTSKNQLNNTGEGLPFNEESGKLPDEHLHQNLYESDFPWYYCVRNLLVKCPIYDLSAVANSATPLDFSCLVAKADFPYAMGFLAAPFFLSSKVARCSNTYRWPSAAPGPLLVASPAAS